MGLFRRKTSRSPRLSICMSRWLFHLAHAVLIFWQPMVLLWTGKVTDEPAAFQLLDIIDIIRFWAEYTFKPIICTCLRRLEGLRLRETPALLKDTIWDLQITMNKDSTPWLFYRRDFKEATFIDTETPSKEVPVNGYLSPPSTDPRRRSIDQSPSPSRRPFRMKSSNCQAQKKFIHTVATSEEYSWVLNRSTHTDDHIMIRISRQGHIFRPYILFYDKTQLYEDTTDSNRALILKHEKLRYDPNVGTGFIRGTKSSKYLWSCSRSTLDHISENTQFCAITPLNKIAYAKQQIRSLEEQLFEPIEALLHIGMLLATFEAARERWCKCQRLVNGYEPNMIHCGNTRCHFQWYHKERVSLKEEAKPEPWICPACCKIPKKRRKEVPQIKLAKDYADDLGASD